MSVTNQNFTIKIAVFDEEILQKNISLFLIRLLKPSQKISHFCKNLIILILLGCNEKMVIN